MPSIPFNVCVVRPRGYIHSAAFHELAELVFYSLQDLGQGVELTHDRIIRQGVNVVFGAHLLGPEEAAQLPPATLIVNTEQIGAMGMPWTQAIARLADRNTLWDYSDGNIGKFRQMGATRVRKLGIGFHPRLARITACQHQDIDVLFSGAPSERRLRILAALKEAGLKVNHVFGLYGQERDALIARAKIVLNLPSYDAQIFEVARVFDLPPVDVPIKSGSPGSRLLDTFRG